MTEGLRYETNESKFKKVESPDDEIRRDEFDKYHELETGDLFNFSSNNDNNTTSTQTDNQQINPQANAGSKQRDPIELFSQMISAGFKPSRDQLMNYSKGLNLDSNNADKWFALLFKKLLQQRRNQSRN